MARKPRIHYPGAVFHVILRGNAGNPVFFDDRDRYRLYLILQYAVEMFDCRIHGFCLMTNHIHLVIQPGDIPLSRIMQNVSLRYTKWINYTRSRTGHVFQGRYKAILVDADAYLVELVRYVHLNPVRAGAAATAEEWRWSGHRAYLGIETLPWLTTDWVLGMLSSEEKRARESYAEVVNAAGSEGRRNEFHTGTCDGRVLGDDHFVDTVLEKISDKRLRITIMDILKAVCGLYGCTFEALRAPGKARPFTEARAVASLLVQELPYLSLTQLGKELNRDIAPLGRVGRRLGNALEKDPSLRDVVEKARQQARKIAERLA
jgi:putative transposase